MAKKALDELLTEIDDVNLEEVEVLRNPWRSLKDGVKFIPTLKCGNEQLSGILLDHDKIKAFIQKVQSK